MRKAKEPSADLLLRHTGISRLRTGSNMEAWQDYVFGIEEDFSDIASRLSGVEFDGNSGGDWEDDDGREWDCDDHSASVYDAAQLEPLVELTIEMVRKRGFRFGRTFEMEKHVLLPNGEFDKYLRRIYPSRVSRWCLQREVIKLSPKRKASKDFPKKMKHLAVMAARCYGVGGNRDCFQRDSDLQAFLDALAARDRKELIELYKTIVTRRDNEWYLKWARDQEDVAAPDWANKTVWLFMFLDRLREGGLMSQVRGKAKRTVLKYWDDFLVGKPYEDNDSPES